MTFGRVALSRARGVAGGLLLLVSGVLVFCVHRQRQRQNAQVRQAKLAKPAPQREAFGVTQPDGEPAVALGAQA